jgi:hypothetical protein
VDHASDRSDGRDLPQTRLAACQKRHRIMLEAFP